MLKLFSDVNRSFVTFSFVNIIAILVSYRYVLINAPRLVLSRIAKRNSEMDKLSIVKSVNSPVPMHYYCYNNHICDKGDQFSLIALNIVTKLL